MSAYKLYFGTVVHTPKLGEIEVWPRMLIGVSHQGKIDFCSEFNDRNQAAYGSPEAFFAATSSYNSSYEFIDFSKNPYAFLFPGFVDTHIHASQYPNIGIGSELPLLDWLHDYTFDLESKFTKLSADKESFAREVYSKVINKTLANGTTCASYFTTIDTDTTKMFADLLVQKGQRGLVGKVCMDHNPTFPVYEETTEECIQGVNDMIAHCNAFDSKMIKPIITPRFAPLCLRKLMKQLGKISHEHNLPVQTHIAENKDELKLVKKMFPECESYSEVYDAHGLLGPSTILAHAVHLDSAERKLIRKKNCSISHCPLSNTFITSGEAPVKEYLYRDKINVSLGTDLSGGYEQSILGVVRALILVSHHKAMDTLGDWSVSVAEALYMATMGGARACRLENDIGSFAKGKSFDAQLVDIDSVNSNIDVFDFQKPEVGLRDFEKKVLQLIQRWIFSGDDRNCVKVWCNGKMVVDKTNTWVYI